MEEYFKDLKGLPLGLSKKSAWDFRIHMVHKIVIPPYIATTIKPQLYPTPSLSTEHAH